MRLSIEPSFARTKRLSSTKITTCRYLTSSQTSSCDPSTSTVREENDENRQHRCWGWKRSSYIARWSSEVRIEPAAVWWEHAGTDNCGHCGRHRAGCLRSPSPGCY